ncbi:MAG: ribosome assembly cofactor RimP [Bacteroidia bacterium]
MIQKNTVKTLAEDFLKESENYLIDVLVSSSNKIRVFIENDEHVSIQDCIALSKHIESNLDRETEDFELEVSSPGIDQPFKSIRQYRKYVGKTVDVLMNDGSKVSGELIGNTESEIEVLPEKKAGKKKIKQTSHIDNESIRISLNDIKETRLIIIF